MIIPCKKTTVTQEQAQHAFNAALPPELATSQAVALLMAHTAFETARWTALYNYNLGNIGATTDSDSFRYEDCGFDTPPGNPVYFAAYATIDKGAEALVSLLKRRYVEAWAELTSASPDPYVYVAKLKQRGYFTAPLEPYQAGVASLYREYAHDLGVPPNPKGEPSPGGGDLPLLPLPPTIQYGSKGDTVKRWQYIAGSKPDGIFGPLTRQATTIWQKHRGLKMDGIVGPITWRQALS